MRSRFAIAASAIALGVVALAVVACGGSDDTAPAARSQQRRSGSQLQKGATLTLWIMPNGPSRRRTCEKMVAPFTARPA